MSFVKHDSGKLRFDLLDHEFEAELADVLTHGAGKYADNNWQNANPPEAKRRYYAALRRHLLAYLRGEVTDPDSGKPHLACIGVNVMFLRWFQRNGSTERDDPDLDVEDVANVWRVPLSTVGNE